MKSTGFKDKRARSSLTKGAMAEWLRRGLQILARRFDSGSRLQNFGHAAYSAMETCLVTLWVALWGAQGAIRSVVPVIEDALSLHKNSMLLMRFCGAFPVNRVRLERLFGADWGIGAPGRSMLMVTPKRALSRARARVNPRAPCWPTHSAPKPVEGSSA